ncbi:MAG: hypothetical protein U1F77_18465 [Kiritimatiellia bacterium]
MRRDLLTLLLVLAAAGASAQTPRELLRKGAEAQAAGRTDEARDAFEKALAVSTNDTLAASAAAYDLGTLLYKKGEKEPAAAQFKTALRTADTGIQRDAFHNQGNLRMQAATAHEQEGKLEDAIKEVAGALENYDSAMLLDPAAQDTRTNIELALGYEKELKLKLEEQKKKEEEKKKQEEQQKKDQEKQNDPQKNDQEKKDQEKKDQEKKDQQQKDQEKKDQDNKDQQKKDQEKKDQEKKDPEKTDQQQQQKPPEEKKDEKTPEKPIEPGKEEKPQDFTDAREAPKPDEMTPAQAKQLLDAQKEEEKAARARFRITYGRPEKVEKDY